jgi:hypothetical protein
MTKVKKEKIIPLQNKESVSDAKIISEEKKQPAFVPEMSTPIQNEEVKQESAEDAFTAFESTTSEFVAKPENINGTPTIDEQGKVSVFLTFCCYLLSGFHAFLYTRISGVDIITDEMTLTQSEKRIIEPMMYDQKILQWLNSLHPAVWIVLQVEYIYYIKYQTAKKVKHLTVEKTEKIV